jgi:beta-phosphoglucomutase-like phosphatase (HAD superfamily)
MGPHFGQILDNRLIKVEGYQYRSAIMQLEALIFDVDGTLADTERDGHRVAFNQSFAEAGLDWNWSVDQYGELLAITGGKERMRHYIQQHDPDFESPRPDQDLTAFIGGLHAAKTRFYTQLLAAGQIPLRRGVRRLIDAARADNLRLAIATTTTPANVEALLVHSLAPESMDWFEVIGAGDVVANKKPGSDIYDLVLQELGLEASACLAFEDSRNGILSSLGANLKTIITTNHYTESHNFEGAALVADQLGEPDAPMTVQHGGFEGYRCVDMTLLRELHRQT